MRARLLVDRPMWADEWHHGKTVRAGTVVNVTGLGDRITAKHGLGVLNFEPDDAEIIEEDE